MVVDVSPKVAIAQRAFSHLPTPLSKRTLADYQPFFDSLHEDVVMQSASPNGASEFVGRQKIIDYISELFSSLAELPDETLLFRALEFLSNDDDKVVILWREGTENKQTGERSDGIEVAVVVVFEGDLISRLLRLNQ